MKQQNPCCETQRTLSNCKKYEESVSSEEKRLNSRFLDLTRDYGFKIVMADDSHPELMLEFLNAVIPDREIVSIRHSGGNHQPMHRTVCERGGGSVKNQADTLELRIQTVYRINFRERNLSSITLDAHSLVSLSGEGPVRMNVQSYCAVLP